MDFGMLPGMALSAISSLYAANAQLKQGKRAQAQSYVEAEQLRGRGRAVLDGANDERLALYREAGSVGEASVTQAIKATRAYRVASDIARSNAEIAAAKGRQEENRVRDATDRTIGSQTAFFAGGNLDPTTGSPLMLAAMGAAQGESDAMIVRSNASQVVAGQEWNALAADEAAGDALSGAASTIDGTFASASERARGLTKASGIQAASYGVAAQNALTRGTDARLAGMYGAGSTLLNTAAQWAGSKGGSDAIMGGARKVAGAIGGMYG